MIFWIVENGKLVKYERTGECCQCGSCCRKIQYQWDAKGVGNTNENEPKAAPDWSDCEGWSIVYAQGIWWYFLIMDYAKDSESCSALTEDNKCESWHDPESFKPICRYWPFSPKDVEAFPTCTFKFERMEDE